MALPFLLFLVRTDVVMHMSAAGVHTSFCHAGPSPFVRTADSQVSSRFSSATRSVSSTVWPLGRLSDSEPGSSGEFPIGVAYCVVERFDYDRFSQCSVQQRGRNHALHLHHRGRFVMVWSEASPPEHHLRSLTPWRCNRLNANRGRIPVFPLQSWDVPFHRPCPATCVSRARGAPRGIVIPRFRNDSRVRCRCIFHGEVVMRDRNLAPARQRALAFGRSKPLNRSSMRAGWGCWLCRAHGSGSTLPRCQHGTRHLADAMQLNMLENHEATKRHVKTLSVCRRNVPDRIAMPDVYLDAGVGVEEFGLDAEHVACALAVATGHAVVSSFLGWMCVGGLTGSLRSCGAGGWPRCSSLVGAMGSRESSLTGELLERSYVGVLAADVSGPRLCIYMRAILWRLPRTCLKTMRFRY